ncbi:MAG: M28 family peptidase [Planctomycetota bacterium]|mgnify:CR=1 FL=1|nr:M28 family peptidase [Planctomycetota bacterium]
MKTLIFWLIVIAGFVVGSLAFMTQMPGATVLTVTGAAGEDDARIESSLRGHVESFASEFGARGNSYPQASAQTILYIEREMKRANFEIKQSTFDSRITPGVNIEGTLLGTRKKDEILLLGANYDTDGKSPGAEDNASGCAVLFEMLRVFGEAASERTVRVVFFGNGAGQYAGEENSGAWAYAREAHKRGDKIVAMIDFDCLGHFKDAPGSQSVPFPLSTVYPSTGNFVLFAGQLGARDLVRTATSEFRKAGRFPCHGLALPGFLPGVKSGDYAAFAKFDYPAIVATDTGSFRFDKVGTLWDTTERLDYPKMARATSNLIRVVTALAKTGGTL